ncbi:MAG TPA: hypothetical protein VGB14_09375 [Acidimicrobiales bacterium]
MDRVDAAVVVLTAVLVVVATQVSDFAGAFAVVAAGASLVAVNHVVPRRPRLVVEYRNPDAGGRPEVWADPPCSVHVYVRNDGRGSAEGVEVRFDGLGAATVSNEVGSPPGPALDISTSPLLYTACGRVLNPGQEWCIARLEWAAHHRATGGSAVWRAWAKGAPERTGTVRVRLVDQAA